MNCYKRLPLEGLVNARDLGGFPTHDGKMTKYGVFIRSEVPNKLTENDIRFLRDYGVNMSLDLRGADECERTPSALASVEGFSYVSRSMMNAEAASASSEKKEKPRPPEPGNEKSFWDIDWVPVYISILDTARTWVRDTINAVADHEGCILYHCYTGKDRTGILTALLLGLCGVDRLDIMWDYSLSMTCLRPFYETMDTGILFRHPDGTPDFSCGFYRTAPETIEAVLSHLENKYGGVTEYVRGCGVSQKDIDTLVSRMTVTL